MALVPIVSQSWDTTSVFTPTRMNNIEQNLAIVSDATGVKYSNGVSVKDKIDSMNTLKTGNLVQGTEYSTYVDTLYVSQAEEKNGIVNVRVNITLKTVSATSGWKEIFRLPSNITKPTSVQTINVIMGDDKYNQFRIGTDGSVSLNGTSATARYISYVGNITYIV